MKNPIVPVRRCLVVLAFVVVALLLPAGGARAQTQEVIWQLPGAGTAVTFSPDGQAVLGGNQLRAAANGQLIRTFNLRQGTGSSVNAVAFSPDGQYCAIGVQAFNQNLNFFRVSDGFRTVPTDAHSNGTTTAQFSPDGQFVATGGRDGTVKLWSVPDFTLQHTFLGAAGYSARIFSLVFSADGQYLAVGGQGGLIILQISTAKVVQRLVEASETVQSVALSANGSTLAGGFFTSQDGVVYNVKLWRFSDGALLKTIPASDQPINSVAFQPDARVIASGGGDDAAAGVVRFFNVKDSSELGSFPQDPNNLSSYVKSVAYSPSGQFVAYARADSFVVVARNPFFERRR
ncbi:MAG: WD40 repeat domain-containing protein [Chthoniobacterales bacterium]